MRFERCKEVSQQEALLRRMDPPGSFANDAEGCTYKCSTYRRTCTTGSYRHRTVPQHCRGKHGIHGGLPMAQFLPDQGARSNLRPNAATLKPPQHRSAPATGSKLPAPFQLPPWRPRCQRIEPRMSVRWRLAELRASFVSCSAAHSSWICRAMFVRTGSKTGYSGSC